MSRVPIGIFDSGVGGLSVWQELRKTLPNESLLYFADGKNCPYGQKPTQEVLQYVKDAVENLLEVGVKLIVIACNSATAVAIDYLRENYDVPFVGMEPAVKPAALCSKSGVIGILATQTALEGDIFKETSALWSIKAKIITSVGKGFVEIVEQERENTPEAIETIRKAVEPLLFEGVDKIVLGCTHYPFLKDAINGIIGDRDIELMDSTTAVAKRTKFLLDKFDIMADADNIPEYSFATFAGDEYLSKIANRVAQIKSL